eukprot:2834824-Rhodomonas_salina.1
MAFAPVPADFVPRKTFVKGESANTFASQLRALRRRTDAMGSAQWPPSLGPDSGRQQETH